MKLITLEPNFAKLTDQQKFDILFELYLINNPVDIITTIVDQDFDIYVDMVESELESKIKPKNYAISPFAWVAIQVIIVDFGGWCYIDVFDAMDSLTSEDEMEALFPDAPHVRDVDCGIDFMPWTMPNARKYAADKIAAKFLMPFLQNEKIKQYLVEEHSLLPELVPLDITGWFED